MALVSSKESTTSTISPIKGEAPLTDLGLYLRSISEPEQIEYQLVELGDVLLDIQKLRSPRTHPVADKILRTITPLISFVDRYAKSVDIVVSNVSAPAAIVWGCLRAVIRYGVSIPYFFDDLLVLVEKFGSQLLLYNRYDEWYHDVPTFQTALSATFKDAIILLRAARDTLAKNVCFSAWLLRTWSNLEKDFEDISRRLADRLSMLKQLSTLLHREVIHRDLVRQETFRTDTTNAIQQLSIAASRQATLTMEDSNRDLTAWLAPVDYQEDRRHATEKRSPGTCEWLFDQSFYQSWSQSRDHTVAWVHGNAGVGKTILSASIIERLEAETSIQASSHSVVVYFYFKRTDITRSSAVDMCRTILAQLIATVPAHSDSLQAAFTRARKFGSKQMTLSDKPFDILHNILVTIEERVFLVLDGLEECDDMESHLPKLLNAIYSSKSCRCLILSRDIPYIRQALRTAPHLHLCSELVNTDISTYFHTEMNQDLLVGQDSNQLVSVLVSRADGQFLFASLIMEELNQSCSPNDLRNIAMKMPDRLGSYYDLMMTRLMQASPQRAQLAHKICKFVFCSLRPVTWMELQHLLAFDSSTNPSYRSESLPFKPAVLSMCQPFVEYDSRLDSFRPAHSSMVECLATRTPNDTSIGDSCFRMNLVDVHRNIATILLEHMSNYKTDQDQIMIDDRPLGLYATTYWCTHFLSAEVDSSLADASEIFLSDEDRRRGWLMDWLITNREAYPLGIILRTLDKVLEKLKGLGKCQGSRLDVLEDAVVILTMIDRKIMTGPRTNSSSSISNFERDIFVRDIAGAYKISNRLEDGIRHFEEAKIVVGLMSDNAVWIYNGLGMFYDLKGDIEAALESQKTALSIQQSSQNSNQLEQVLTINEFGRLYRHQGNYTLAQERHLQALDILRAHLPESDMQIVFTKSHLAKTYRHAGRLRDAANLQKDVYAARVKHVGPEHPQSLWDLSDLAKCYRDLGELEEACALQEKSTRLRIQVLGLRHNDTLWSLNDLALMYEKTEAIDRAIQLHSQAFEGQKSLFGEAYPTTVWSQQKLEQLQEASGHSHG